MLNALPDDFDCALLIWNPKAFHLIRASFDSTTADIILEPRRLVYEDFMDVEGLAMHFRMAGYRVDFIGEDDGFRVYTIIAATLILTPQTLASTLMQFVAMGGVEDIERFQPPEEGEHS